MATTAEDLARLVVSIELSQSKLEKQAAAIARAAERNAKAVENSYKTANDNVGRSFENGARRATMSVGQTRAAVSNLSFQLNDIAMGLASGTSPFTIMVQQGSQVAQVLQGTGGLAGAVRTLGGAFASMVNPVSLASFAIIGLGGAAIQYLTTLKSDVPDANELLKQHAEIIRSFDEAYDFAEKGVKKYTEAAKQVELQKLIDQYGDLKTAVSSSYDELSHGLRQIPASDFGGAETIDRVNRALALLERETPAAREFAAEMIKIENAKGVPDVVREAAKAARQMAEAFIPMQDAIEGTERRLNNVKVTGEAAKKAFEALTSAALGLGEPGAKAIGTIADKITKDLIPATERAIKLLGEYLGNYLSLQRQVEQSPLGTLTPLVSGGGQFLNPDQFQTFKANEQAFREAGESAAAAMIRGFESFSAKAYGDTRSSTGEFDAWRVGFGSDTTTRANGMIEKVTRETVVTLADAERDLARRLLEFQNGIQNAIGIDTWKSLNEGQQAALSSIAYNYGSLPKKIVEAIKSGGGPEVVAQAIASLSANPSRRKQEASAYLSGSGMSLKEAGIGVKTPDDIFKGSLEQVQQRIALLNAEYEAQAKLNPLVNDYGYAVEKARIEQQLLADAQKAGLEITPQLRDQISQYAENLAKASARAEQLKDSNNRLRDSMQEAKEFGKGLLSGFISDLREGKSASEALANALNKVGDKLLDIALNSLFGLGGGGGGGLGFLSFIPKLFGFEDGGIARNGKPVMGGKPMKRYARGGVAREASIFGEAGTEAAVPLPDGRSIPVTFTGPKIPRGGVGGSVSYSMPITINAPGADAAKLEQVRQEVRKLGRDIPAMVDARNKTRELRKTRA